MADESLITDVRHYAVIKGLLIKTKEEDIFRLCLPAFTLRPTPFSRKLFLKAIELQNDFNTLMHKVNTNRTFLQTALRSTIAADDFTARLHDLCLKSDPDAPMLTILRCDYMNDLVNDEEELKQVEINTIASGCCSLTNCVSDIHNYVLQRENAGYSVPDNDCLSGIIDSFHAAISYYNKLNCSSNTVVLVIILEGETNIVDQRLIEFGLWDKHRISCLRATFHQVIRYCTLSDGKLLYKDREVGMVYFRAGYVPEHYPTEAHWQARQMMEVSAAIQCPSVAAQLAGCKKIQQVLTEDNVPEELIGCPETARRLRATFTRHWGLESISDQLRTAIYSHPERYVMKPQKEGGGNNLYGAQIKEALAGVDSLPSHVIMQRLFPSEHENLFVTGDGEPAVKKLVSELGVFGCILGHGPELVYSTSPGWLLRSKGAEHNEGGMSSGLAALDTPQLV